MGLDYAVSCRARAGPHQSRCPIRWRRLRGGCPRPRLDERRTYPAVLPGRCPESLERLGARRTPPVRRAVTRERRSAKPCATEAEASGPSPNPLLYREARARRPARSRSSTRATVSNTGAILSHECGEEEPPASPWRASQVGAPGRQSMASYAPRHPTGRRKVPPGTRGGHRRGGLLEADAALALGHRHIFQTRVGTERAWARCVRIAVRGHCTLGTSGLRSCAGRRAPSRGRRLAMPDASPPGTHTRRP